MTKYERLALQKDFYINHEDMCIGDNSHNEYMDILLRDVEMDDFQIAFLNKYFKRNWKTGNWVFDSWTVRELSKINTILRYHNNLGTLQAKIDRLRAEFSRGCWVTQWLNASKLSMVEALQQYLNERLEKLKN